jgi:hypothetical protein
MAYQVSIVTSHNGTGYEVTVVELLSTISSTNKYVSVNFFSTYDEAFSYLLLMLDTYIK